MKRLNYLMLTGFAVVTAGLLVAGPSPQNAPKSYKLEGVWTATADNPFGGAPYHWTCTLAPTDPSGKKAVVRGEFIVPIPSQLFVFVPELTTGPYAHEYFTSFYGEAEMTGPDTALMTIFWYGMRTDAAGSPEIANIGVSTSETKFLAENKAEITFYMAWYPPTPTAMVTPADKPFAVFPFNGAKVPVARFTPIPVSAFTVSK